MIVTHQSLLDASAGDRLDLVVSHLVASVRAFRPGDDTDVDPGIHLADLAIDSLQIVELKFGLDELIGAELPVDVVIANPTLRELAEASLREGGL